MRQSQRILAVVNTRELYEKVDKVLDRSSIEVNRVPSGAGALILVGNLRYDLILVEAPLTDIGLPDFLAAVRTLDSPCAGSSIVVLARAPEDVDVSRLLLEDDVTVVPAGTPAPQIQSRIAAALGVAVRRTMRLLVQVDAHLESGDLRRVAQTANVSESGMLLSGAPPLPIGSTVSLSFELPGDPKPLSMKAQVVRHAAPEVENITGIGVRFADASADAATRLRDFLAVGLERQALGETEGEEVGLDEASTSRRG